MSAKASMEVWWCTPNKITKTEHDEETGEDVEQVIPFMKGYTVFNVEQIDGLPAHYYTKAQAPQL